MKTTEGVYERRGSVAVGIWNRGKAKERAGKRRACKKPLGWRQKEGVKEIKSEVAERR